MGSGVSSKPRRGPSSTRIGRRKSSKSIAPGKEDSAASLASVGPACIPEERITAAFSECDTDGNGKIEIAQLLRLFTLLGLPLKADELEPIFKEVDLNADGVVDHREFVSWLYKGDRVQLLLHLHSASELPSLDLFSESDPYALAYVARSGEVVGDMAQWHHHKDCGNPCWNSVKDLGATVIGSSACAEDQLVIELYDKDAPGKPDDPIGSIELPLRNVRIDQWYDMLLHLEPSAAKKCAALGTKPAIRFRIVSTPPKVKHVFLVRHGESLWNKAQKERDVSGALSQVDHPLSKQGLEQCIKLREKILQAEKKGPTEWTDGEAQFFGANLILSSPLTRAVQTTLVGVQPIVTRLNGSLRLCRNAREQRNRGGRDTTGAATGEEGIMERVQQALRQAGASEEETTMYTSGIRLDATEVEHRWWNSSKESATSVNLRLEEFVEQLRFIQEERIVVVGHSHFFRALLQKNVRDDTMISGVDRKTLLSRKLLNCGVLKLTLDFNSDPDRPICAVEPLLDSGFDA